MTLLVPNTKSLTSKTKRAELKAQRRDQAITHMTNRINVLKESKTNTFKEQQTIAKSIEFLSNICAVTQRNLKASQGFIKD